MMKKTVALLLAAIPLLWGCVDEFEPHTVVKGKVVEAETGKPAKDIYIYIIESVGFLSDPDILTKYICCTDDSGRYELSFEAVEGKRYYVEPVSMKYHWCYNCKQWLNTGEVNEINFQVTPIGTFVLRLVNEVPANESDTLKYKIDGNFILKSYINLESGCTGICNKTVINEELWGNSSVSITWTVISNGTRTDFSDEVFVESTDTVEYGIRY